jgi:cell division protein FtsA
MRKGVVIHSEEVASAVAAAVDDAERTSGVHISSATVSVNGGHLIGLNSKGVVAISSASREISIDDRLRAEEAATVVQLPANREILQVFARNYHVDGQENIKDPVGMRGVRLEVDTHIVTAASPAIRILEQVFSQSNIHLDNRIVAGFASAEAVLTRDQKESGTVLVDIGAGTTNLVVFEEGEVQHVAVIPMGGVHITNDLAIGLKTDIPVAELVKQEFASALEDRRSSREVTVTVSEDEKIQFDRRAIDMIVQSRLDEIFEHVDKELRKIQRSRKLPGGVVLTGGSSQIKMLADFAKDRLELPARTSRPTGYGGVIDTSNSPAFSTAVGLMLIDMAFSSSANNGAQSSN